MYQQVLIILIDNLNSISNLSLLLTLKSVNSLTKYLVIEKLKKLEIACNIIKKHYYKAERFAAYKCEPIITGFNLLGEPVYKRCYVIRIEGVWFILKGKRAYSVYCYTGLLTLRMPIVFFQRVSKSYIKEIYKIDSFEKSLLQDLLIGKRVMLNKDYSTIPFNTYSEDDLFYSEYSRK